MSTDDPDRLFALPLTGGVYRTAHHDDLADRLRAAGWSVATLQPFDDRSGFYTEIAVRLNFPHYFGRNLDALWDCLRAVKEPTAVIIPWNRFAHDQPESARRLSAVLEERAGSDPAFAVVLV